MGKRRTSGASASAVGEHDDITAAVAAAAVLPHNEVSIDAVATAANVPPVAPTPIVAVRASKSNGNLTNYQRKVICEFYQKSGGVMSQKDLAQWTKHEFNLKKTPAQSTISGILRRQHEFVHMSALELGIKKRRVVQHPQLDQALANWVLQCAHRGITVQGDMTKEKAKHFAKMLGIPEDEQPEFSNGWLHSFQLRHNFSFRKFNSDNSSSSANVANVAAAGGSSGSTSASSNAAASGASRRKPNAALQFTTMDALIAETDKFALADIFAMDETCVLYTLPPTPFAAADDPLSAKKRVVVALAANADGSEKLAPLFVGHHAAPKCLRGKSPEQHGLHYFANPKAWMTGVIFSRYVQRLDFAMATQKRRILLLLNDAPSHVVTHLELTHVVLLVLPTGAATMLNAVTAHLVPLFKKRFRRFHVRHVIDKADDVVADATSATRFDFGVDALTAMKWATAAWDDVTRESVVRAWQATHTLTPARVAMLQTQSNDTDNANTAAATTNDDHESAFLDAELAHLFQFLRLPDAVPISTYLDDDAMCANSVHEEYFEIVQPTDEVPDDEVATNDTVDEHGASGSTGASTSATSSNSSSSTPSLSLQDKLKAFRDVMQVLKDRNESNDSAFTALRRVQDAIRTEARHEIDPMAQVTTSNSGSIGDVVSTTSTVNRDAPTGAKADADAIGGNSSNSSAASAFDSASLDFAAGVDTTAAGLSATMTALEHEATFMDDALNAQVAAARAHNDAHLHAAAQAAADAEADAHAAAAEAMLNHDDMDEHKLDGDFDHAVI